MKKRAAGLLLTLALLWGMMPAALAAGMDNFKTSNTDFAGKFTDLTQGAWYMDGVKTAYELGLVLGTSDTTFSPDGNITVGSALALASRLHSIYQTGTAHFEQGSPWYQVYVDYALANGIITQGQFTDYNANATRRQFATILAKALPAGELTAINTVADGAIPDLAAGSAGYADIYTLYRAGVLTGNDKYGTFAPETTIGRSSVAAIVARMAVPSLRQSVTLAQAPIDPSPDPTPTPTPTPDPVDPEPSQPQISSAALSSAKNNIAEALSAVVEGQDAMDLAVNNSGFMEDLMGATMTLTGIGFGGVAVIYLDRAADNVLGSNIPVSYGSYTSLWSLIVDTRDDLWEACDVDADRVTELTWRYYHSVADPALDEAAQRIQVIQDTLNALG